MDYTLYVAICILSLLSGCSAQNVTYEDLPQGTYSEVSVEISVSSLSHLYVMTREFVNIVFKPFSAIEEFIYSIVTENQGNFLNELLAQWQTSLPWHLFIAYKLAAFEVGYMTCLVAGCLFIIFVPLVGAIMCCCRTCCDNCGGEMTQKKSRTHSKWRHCLCISLLILTVFMAVPCVFVFLTNEWVTDVVQIIPEKTNESLSNIIKYLDNVPVQFDYVTDQYSLLDGRLRNEVNNIDQSVGVPVQQQFNGAAQPVFAELETLSALSKTTLAQLEAVDSATNNITTSVSGIEFALDTVRNNITTAVSACNGTALCDSVSSTADQLTLGGNFSSLDDLSSQIAKINESLSFDIDGAIADAQKQIDDIPAIVKNNSAAVTDELLNSLNDVNNTIESSIASLPLDEVTNLKNQISNFDDTISNAFDVYSNNYDIYRYAAGIVLGSLVAVICLFYLLGLFCGCGAYKADPSNRPCISNCGGLLIMSAVGFSFIFSWLLMILVTLSFTIGGHGERYVCQNFESPYEGLKFTDRILNGSLDDTLQMPGANITLYGIVESCQANASIYTALKLENRFNVTEFVANATEQVKNLTDMVASFNEPINITIYTPDVEQALNDLTTSGLDSINFTAYLETINEGITQTDLIAYAQFLNDTADNLTASVPAVADSLRQSSYDLVVIQETMVAPLDEQLTVMNTNVLALEQTSQTLNDTVNQTEQALIQFDAWVASNGTDVVQDQITIFANLIGDDVIGYADWLEIQITTNFGACRPVFLVYTEVVSILCDYLMDVLNGLWFSLGWILFFIIPAAIVGMKLAKFFRNFRDSDEDYNGDWNEMDGYNRSNNNGVPPSSASKFRSAKIHPSQYY
uniref:Prominin-1-like n=1 Tax=Phallusia mammillata TaxID=59560 RepID=A0A6F9DPX0_9ASCI|nr:prominin-1-like [Phallusia mammillata]